MNARPSSTLESRLAEDRRGVYDVTSMSSDPRSALIAAIRDAGIAIDEPERIVADGKLTRFHVDGDRHGSRNGWCILFDDAGGDRVDVVFSKQTAEDDTGSGLCGSAAQPPCNKWSSTLVALPPSTQGEWPELLLKTTGIGQRADNSIGDVSDTEILNFVGTKYVGLPSVPMGSSAPATAATANG